MDLNKENILVLIQEFQRHRILWDPKDKSYFNKVKKQNAWEEIGRTLNISPECAKKKISSLLGSFRREKSKGKICLGTGKDAQEVYKSDWFAFKSFSFLLDKDNKNIINSATMNSDADSIKNEKYSRTSCSSADSDTALPFSLNMQNENAEEEEKELMEMYIKKRKEELEDNRMQQAFRYLQQPEDTTKKFTDYLADKLNQFNPRVKATLIHKINTIIFDAEMDKYSNTPSSLSTSIDPSTTPD